MPLPCPFCAASALAEETIGSIPHTGCSDKDCILSNQLFRLDKWQQRSVAKDADFAISQQVAGMIEAALAQCPTFGFVISNEQSRKELINYAQRRGQDIDHDGVRQLESIANGTNEHESFLTMTESNGAQTST